MKINKVLITVTLTVICTSPGESFKFREKLNKVIGKAKEFYKSKFGKDKTWHFLGHDASEYPGTDAKFRAINAAKWKEYYKCLKLQVENLGPHKSVIPEAVAVFEGGSVKLECKICISPTERESTDSIEWEWAQFGKTVLEQVQYTEHILLSPDDKTLQLYSLDLDQTGQYMCRLGDSLTAPYFLTVLNNSDNLREVHPEFAPRGPYPQPQLSLPSYGLVLDTVWSNWSPCSRCGFAGKRHKLGYCVVAAEDFLVQIKEDKEVSENNNGKLDEYDIESSSKSIIKKSIQSKQTEDKSTSIHQHNAFNHNFSLDATLVTTSKSKNKEQSINVNNIDKEILKIFRYGIPCRSHILPESIKNIPEVAGRQSEIMTGYCKEPCQDSIIFEVRDKDGKIIERANNSAGIYSMLQGIPPVEPPVERRLQYETKGKTIVLTCPGNLNSEIPISWQVGTKNVVPSLIAEESNGRIYVSVMEKIYIKKAKISDSNIYSCWQNKELAGIIRLIVEKKLELHFNHHIMLLGIIMIISTFLYIFIKAFSGRKYAKV